MTKEELEHDHIKKISENYVNESWGSFADLSGVDLVMAGIGVAKIISKEKEKWIEELEQQIEKMKCCGNCMWSDCDGKIGNPPCKYCDFNNKWGIKGGKKKMTIEMYQDVMNHLQIDKYRELIIEQDHKINELEKACEETQELLDKQIEATYRLDKENAELKKNCERFERVFMKKEYFEIADKTANERIKELERYETEITVDDYSPYDENTWGMMHEEMFVPKDAVIDMLKEIYAYIGNLKKENAELKELLKQWLQTSKVSGCDNINIVTDTEQFLNIEVPKWVNIPD